MEAAAAANTLVVNNPSLSTTETLKNVSLVT
jgi:hypothetical protein